MSARGGCVGLDQAPRRAGLSRSNERSLPEGTSEAAIDASATTAIDAAFRDDCSPGRFVAKAGGASNGSRGSQTTRCGTASIRSEPPSASAESALLERRPNVPSTRDGSARRARACRERALQRTARRRSTPHASAYAWTFHQTIQSRQIDPGAAISTSDAAGSRACASRTTPSRAATSGRPLRGGATETRSVSGGSCAWASAASPSAFRRRIAGSTATVRTARAASSGAA